MSVVCYPPVGRFGTQRDLQREINRIFNTVFPAQPKESQQAAETAAWRPVVDVHEDESSYIIDAELPGLTRDDVKISFQDGTLTVEGERSYRYEKKEGEGVEANGATQTSSHRRERVYGKFSRSFKFPVAVNSDGISARFDSGVLTVRVPKAEAVRPRQIEIK